MSTPAPTTAVPPEPDPRAAVLVRQVIERVADQWTMLVLEALEEHGTLRFTQVGDVVEGISQKMLTQTLRQMESDGLVRRTVYAEVPPRVEYALTELGSTLSFAFCGVWQWAEAHHAEVEAARRDFSARKAARRTARTPSPAAPAGR